MSISDRNAEIVRLCQGGASYREVGVIYNISYERVRQIMAKAGHTRPCGRPPKAKKEPKMPSVSKTTPSVSQDEPISDGARRAAVVALSKAYLAGQIQGVPIASGTLGDALGTLAEALT